jgi:hypothetical protein
MKSACARFCSESDEMVVKLAVWYASRITSACLKTLSLKAPRNCTPKKGPNRRSASSLNWLRSLTAAFRIVA